MKLKLTVLWLIALPFFVTAQNGRTIASGARGAAMSNTSVTFQDVFALTKNQAGIAFLQQASVGILAEQRFLSNDIRHIGFVAALPSDFGSFGLLVQHFGFDTYNEQKVGLAYSRKLFEKVALGAQFDYLNTRISEYGSQGVLTFEAGLQAEILEGFWLGAAVFNPIRTQVQDSIGVINTTAFNFGAAYLFSNKITVAAEVEKDFQTPAIVSIGLDYQLIERVSLRVGISSVMASSSFGVGVRLQNIYLDFAATYHQVLGFSPTFSMHYTFDKTQ